MAEKNPPLQSSNDDLKAYFEVVCKIVGSNINGFNATYDGYVIDGEHVLFSFNNGIMFLTEFDVLAAISITPVDEILKIQSIKRIIDGLVPASNVSYHTLSSVIDSHFMGLLVDGNH